VLSLASVAPRLILATTISIAQLPHPSFYCSCVISLWRTLPFVRKFTRRVHPAARTQEASSVVLGGQSRAAPRQPLEPSDAEKFFSNATLVHALEQLCFMLRDVVVGLPAFVLAVASLVRLPSLVANITSACITRQVCHSLAHVFFVNNRPCNCHNPCNAQISSSEPVASTRVFNLIIPPATNFIRFSSLTSSSLANVSHDSMWLSH
jgi:hypothetical protein